MKNSAVASCEGFVSVFQLKISRQENGSKGQTRQEMLEHVRLTEINVDIMSCRDVGVGLITTLGRVLAAGGCCYPVVPLIRKLSDSVDLAFLPGCSCFFFHCKCCFSLGSVAYLCNHLLLKEISAVHFTLPSGLWLENQRLCGCSGRSQSHDQ